MNAVDIAVILIVAAIAAVGFRYNFKKRKNNKSCGGGCSGCSMKSSCNESEKFNDCKDKCDK